MGIGALVVLAGILGSGARAGATTLPSGFSQQVVASGLTNPTAFAFFPDGRIAIAEKAGVVRLVKNGALLPTPLIDVSSQVNDYWDRGLIGITVDSSFASNPYLYLLYTYENNPNDYEGPKTARLTRVTVTGDTASPSSQVVVLGTVVGTVSQPSCKNFAPGSDCLPSDGASHSVGNVKMTSDGTIVVTVGDSADFNTVDADALRAQDLDSLSGKVLRVDRAGKGLSTNPFWTGNADDNRSKVWAYGIRNAYRFNLRPGSDVPYLGDVGWADWEEISVASAGANLGWPCYEGSGQQGGYAPFAVCQTLYGGTSLASAGTIIARVTTPLGSGAGLPVIRDGDKPPVGNQDSSRQYDSWDGANFASEDWVGYSFPSPHTFDRVVFQEGKQFADGGWFLSPPTVQVRQSGTWVAVSNLNTTPAYAGANGVSYETYTMTFTAIQGDAIRIFGAPAGSAAFISVGELEVFETGGGGGGGGGGGQVESRVTPQSIIARVTTPLGSGAGLGVINNGDKPPVGNQDSSRQYDSWDGDNPATEDWVGYEFASPQNFTKLVFQEGKEFWDGGWFLSLTAEVRQNGVWVAVSNLGITPAYAGANGVTYETYTLTFTAIQGDAIRIFGAPGGAAAFISVGELEAYALVDAGGGSQTTAKPPLHEYSHNGGSAAVTAGTFYTGSVYPSEYQGAFFFGDFALDSMTTLRVDANDALVPGSVTGFAQDADGPVDIEMGPDGLLYYLAISANELRRIQYTAGNTPPTAVASANPTSGAAPLTVQFSSTGSSDPDGDPLTFDWDFGDGSPHGSGPTVQHTYQLPNGPRTVTLTVSDNRGGVASDTVTITVGNLPPTATISAPAATLTFKVGDVITYSGSATDPEQGTLPASALSWQIVLHHCPGGVCHSHPFSSGSGSGGTFTAPDHGDESYFEIILTATDAGGLTGTASRTIQPQTVQVTVTTSPSGLNVTYDGTSGAGPLVRTTIVGSIHTLNAPSPQGASTFQSWSDGGAQQHQVTLGTTNMTYTATFSTPACPADQFRAEYFANLTLSGSPVLTPCETAINNDWGNGGPGNGIPNDNFSVRWTGQFTFAAGSYVFTARADDGVRVWVDGTLIIDQWKDQPPTTYQATVSLTAGTHEVRVEYYEKAGGAVAQVSWASSPGGGGCPTGQYQAQYYNNVNLSGTPTFTRCKAAPINHNWGTGGPGNGVPTNHFSVRWTGRFNFTAGSKTFTTRSDDGIRLWVDGVLLINFWTDHGPTTRTATRTMTAGEHEVKVEYYERTGRALIQVSW
jgi:glucose/arabinose dehydrogenase/PKD repeat protein